MTPIEIACKAFWESRNPQLKWEDHAPPLTKARMIKAMSAALLALAKQETRPGLISKFHWDIFRAVNRSIANEGKTDG